MLSPLSGILAVKLINSSDYVYFLIYFNYNVLFTFVVNLEVSHFIVEVIKISILLSKITRTWIILFI